MMPADKHHVHRERVDSAPETLVFDPRLGHVAIRLYAAIAAYANQGVHNPSQNTIGRRLGVTAPSIRKATQQLTDTGWVTTESELGPKGNRTGTTYRLRGVGRSPTQVVGLPPTQGGSLRNPGVGRSPTQASSTSSPVLSSEDYEVFPSSSSSPVLRSPEPENVPSPHVPGKKPGGVGGEARGKAQPHPKAAATASRQRPAAPNRSARFIDAMTAIGLKLGADYDMDGRDHASLKSSTADTVLLAEAYASLRTHGWGTEFDWSNLSVHHVVDRINVYREKRNGGQVDTASGVASRSNHVRGRPGEAHGRGEAPARTGQYDHLIHEF